MLKRRPISLFLVMAMLFSLLFTFTPATNVFADGPWTASTGFSSTQGANQWYYQQRPVGGGAFTDITTYSSGAWRGGNGNWISGDACHPDNSYDVVRTWKAPGAGTIRITGTVKKNDTAGGNGVKVSILKNTSIVWG